MTSSYFNDNDNGAFAIWISQFLGGTNPHLEKSAPAYKLTYRLQAHHLPTKLIYAYKLTSPTYLYPKESPFRKPVNPSQGGFAVQTGGIFTTSTHFRKLD